MGGGVGVSCRVSPWSVCGRGECAERRCTGMKHTASAERRSSGSGMSTSKRSSAARPATRFAVCIDNSGSPAFLELHKIYRVLPDADAARDGDIRIVDESGDDYLYPRESFAAIEPPRRVKASLLH